MPASDRVRELLAEFAEAQARPITDSALTKRMRTEATQWINAVQMQRHRVSNPLINPDDLGGEVWRQEIDLHFLLVALCRVRRAVGLATRVDQLHDTLIASILEFDDRVPYLTRLRNVGEHFDDYTVGKGHGTKVPRAQLQTWSMDRDREGNLIWNWLGEQLQVAVTHSASTQLYRGFIAETDRYLAGLRDEQS